MTKKIPESTKIPTKVKSLAEANGYNVVELVKTDAVKAYYALSASVDGQIVPTGLPAFIVCDNANKCTLVDGSAGLKLSLRLFGDE